MIPSPPEFAVLLVLAALLYPPLVRRLSKRIGKVAEAIRRYEERET